MFNARMFNVQWLRESGTGEWTMNDTASPPAQTGRVKWGRIISLIGALGLCVSFFLPSFFFSKDMGVVVDSAARLLFDVSRRQTWYDLSLVFILPFLATAMLSPLLAFRCVPRVDTAKGIGRFLAWVQCAICLIPMLAGVTREGYTVAAFRLSGDWPRIGLCIPPAVGLAGMLLATLALIRACPSRSAATALSALGLYSCAIFGDHLLRAYDGVYYGLWVSLAASGLLALGAVIDWFQSRPRAA
jgi:hypothetical protein